jgi:hypothetical protein
VRAGVSWDAVVRIDGMVKLLLEQYRIKYLPVESVSMQERVRAVEFVFDRLGQQPARTRGNGHASGRANGKTSGKHVDPTPAVTAPGL